MNFVRVTKNCGTCSFAHRLDCMIVVENFELNQLCVYTVKQPTIMSVPAGPVSQGERKGQLEGPLSNCDSQLFSGRFDTDRSAVLTYLLLSKKDALLTFASPNVKKVTNSEQFISIK